MFRCAGEWGGGCWWVDVGSLVEDFPDTRLGSLGAGMAWDACAREVRV